MDGLFLKGFKRPTSKKAVKEAIAKGELVEIEYTSIFGGAESKPLYVEQMAPGQRVTFVGPCPYTSRKFYGTIECKMVKGERKVVVK